MQPGKTVFDVRHGDEWIRVAIEGEVATFHVVDMIRIDIVVEALKKAVAAGALRGTMFTGKVVHDRTATKNAMRAKNGITWLGGKVSLLVQRLTGPEYRIDWEVLPTVTE